MTSRNGEARHSELVYVPGPSAMPLLVAMGLTLVLLGLYSGWAFSALGGLLALAALGRWLREGRQAIERMPRHQRPATMARLPD